MPERIPPQNLDAEQSVLGALLIDKDAIIRVAALLSPAHFYRDANGEVYSVILNLFEKREPIDLITVPDELRKAKKLEAVGGVTYLSSLVSKVPTSANVEFYANIVKDAYIKRQLIISAAKISESSFEEDVSSAELLDRAERSLFSISQEKLHQYFVSIKDVLEISFDRLDELHKNPGGLRGVPTGLKSLDEKLAGLQESNLIILAGRPSLGKTSLALNIAKFAAVEKKVPVAIFSLETSREQLVDRMLADQANVDGWRLTTGRLEEEDFRKIGEAMGYLAEAPIFIDDTPGINVLEIRTKSRRLQMEQGIKLVIVDYLQLAHGQNTESRVQEVSEISQSLKNLARELKVPVLAISQLSRNVESRGEKRPQLSDLRESGCLSADAKIINATTGQLFSIEDIYKKGLSFETFTLNKELKLERRRLKKAFKSGIKKVYELKLASGKTIKASANHPFFSYQGWQPLEQIKVGQFLAVPRVLKIRASTSISEPRLILLAHLLGDGCFVKGQPLHYTNAEMKLIRLVKTAVLKAFPEIKPRIISQENWYHLYLPGKDRNKKSRNPISLWLESLGLYDKRSYEKFIPQPIFGLSLKRQALFLKNLWATDGSITRDKRNNKWRIYYASSSRELINGISNILLRFSIVARIKSSKKGNYRPTYYLDISGSLCQRKFLAAIGCAGKKGKNSSVALREVSKVLANTNVDIIPKEVWQLVESSRVKQGLSTREFHRRLGWAYSGTMRHNNGLSRERLNHILTVIRNKDLQNLARSDVFWDRVLSIKPLGPEPVFDAEVDGNHNFLANDIIVHNSIEQDADVVMFLYREDEENRNDIKLSISKHRNGPTGEIDLFFKGEQTKFYEAEKLRV